MKDIELLTLDQSFVYHHFKFLSGIFAEQINEDHEKGNLFQKGGERNIQT